MNQLEKLYLYITYKYDKLFDEKLIIVKFILKKQLLKQFGYM